MILHSPLSLYLFAVVLFASIFENSFIQCATMNRNLGLRFRELPPNVSIGLLAMASLDVDQKYLGRIADASESRAPLVSKALYQILGLSVVLAKKLYRARKLRKLDTSRDTKSLQLYHQIIWLSREGLSILEMSVLPYTQNGELGAECQVLTTKLRASFYHIFCLFHNNPPITAVSAHSSKRSTTLPLSPRQDNGQRRTRSGSGSSAQEKRDTTPKRGSRDSKGKKPLLRDPIDSITSDASFLTNPYAGVQPGTTPPPGLTPSMPPGFAPIPPKPSSFLLPAIDFVPNTATYFRAASNIATLLLPGAHPLRLSVAIEHAAFLWDCVHDHNGSRSLARRAIRSLREGEDAGISDEQYDDAAHMVGVLGRMMNRRSWEGTPKPGHGASPSSVEPTSATKPGDPFPQTFPPTNVPLVNNVGPTTPSRKVPVYRDEENLPGVYGGPVGGTPRSPTEERRGSKGSRHTRERSGSKSTTHTITPRERTTARERAYATGRGSTYPRDARVRDPETPPPPPPKDISPPSMRTPSKQSTPRRDTSSRISPKDPRITPSQQRRPAPTTSGTSPATPDQRLTYPRPMEVSPKRRAERQQEVLALNGYHTDEGYGGSS
jgi:hypothetical protein